MYDIIRLVLAQQQLVRLPQPENKIKNRCDQRHSKYSSNSNTGFGTSGQCCR